MDINRSKRIFGRNFFSLRKERKWSRDKAAEIFDVGKTTIQNWEHGEDFPECVKILKIADIFHVWIDDLFGRDLADTAHPIPPFPGRKEDVPQRKREAGKRGMLKRVEEK